MTRVLLLLMVFCLPRWVQAEDLVDRVQETYRGTGTFRADFVQKTHVEILDRDVEEKGELTFAAPGRFLIHYKGPRERQYISDGKKLWIYHPADKEVEVFENVRDLVSREALAFLGGLGEMGLEFRVSQKGADELELIPRRRAAPFTKLHLKIDPATHLVREALLFPKGGNRSRYVFSEVRTNAAVSDALFRLDTHGLKLVHPPH